MPKANEVQVGGSHYKTKAIQPWDFIASNKLPFLEGNVIKYVARWKDKNGLQDLEKAQHYLQKLIESEKEAQAIVEAKKEVRRLQAMLKRLQARKPFEIPLPPKVKVKAHTRKAPAIKRTVH